MSTTTRALTVIYENVPKEIQAWMETEMPSALALCPSWVEDLTVRYDGELHDAEMASLSSYKNRWAVLIVTGLTLSQSDEDRTNTLRHEMIHILLAPFTDCVKMCVPAAGDCSSLLEKWFKDAEEAVVEDLARATGRYRQTKSY